MKILKLQKNDQSKCLRKRFLLSAAGSTIIHYFTDLFSKSSIFAIISLLRRTLRWGSVAVKLVKSIFYTILTLRVFSTFLISYFCLIVLAFLMILLLDKKDYFFLANSLV